MCTKLKGQTKTFNIQKQYIFSNVELTGDKGREALAVGYSDWSGNLLAVHVKS
jgi:hypothetical protein